jgi:hypothetical protein
MTIEQTVEIPASHRLYLDLPSDVPIGKAKVTIVPFAEPPAQYAEVIPGYPYRVPTEEEARQRRKRAETDALPVCKTVEEALKAGAAQAEARKADPSLGSLKHWHGILENSKAWGKDVDAVAEIRKMRDEWGDPWEEALNPPETKGKNG